MRSSVFATIALAACLVNGQSPALYFAGGPTVATPGQTDMWSFTGTDMALATDGVTALLLEVSPGDASVRANTWQFVLGTRNEPPGYHDHHDSYRGLPWRLLYLGATC